MGILSRPVKSLFQIMIIAIVIATKAHVCSGDEVSPEGAIETSRFLSAQLAVADCEVSIAAATLEQADQRSDRLKALHHEGNAAWIEWQQAELQRQSCEYQLLASMKLRDWLQTEVKNAISSPRLITHASLLLRLPQSDVPIGWLTYPANAGSPNDDHQNELVSALRPVPPSNDEATLTLRQKDLQQRLQSLESQQARASAVDSVRTELRLCEARAALNSARSDLTRLQTRIVKRVCESGTSPASPQTTSGAELLNSGGIRAEHILLATLQHELSRADAAMHTDVGEWNANHLIRSAALQAKGFCSTSDVLRLRQQAHASHQALDGARELQAWKTSWLERMTANRTIPAVEARPSVSKHQSETVYPAVSRMSNISMIEMLIEVVRLELALEAVQKAMRNQVTFCEELQQRLIQQARPNENEVADSERLQRFTEASIQGLTHRREVLSCISLNSLALEADVNQGHSFRLIDSEALDVLIQNERLHVHANEVAQVKLETRKISRLMSTLQELHEQGLASANELLQLKMQSIELKHREQLAREKQSRAEAVVRILTLQEREVSSSP